MSTKLSWRKALITDLSGTHLCTLAGLTALPLETLHLPSSHAR